MNDGTTPMQCSSMKLVKNNAVALNMLLILTGIVRGFFKKYFGLELEDTIQNKYTLKIFYFF